MKGVEAANRTAISNPKVRKVLKNMVDFKFENKVLKETILKMKIIKNHDNIAGKLLHLLADLLKTNVAVPRE